MAPITRGDPVIAALLFEPLELWWARRLQPQWRNEPLVAIRENRVRHATPEARREGVTPGMPLSGARLRSEELQVTEPAEAELQAAWETVLRELYGITPFIDGSRRGRAFLRVTASEARLVAEAFDVRVGHASTRQMAELAALSVRPGECRTLSDDDREERFLARLPLRFLQGVGLSPFSLQRLHWLGVESAGQLGRWRRSQLTSFLGPEAQELLPYLHGPRESRIALLQPSEALRRTIRFEEPLFEPGPLEAALGELARSLAEALEGRSSGRLTLVAEVGGVQMRATRFAKKPLREVREIALLAGLALHDSGAAPVGIEALTLELPEPVREAWQGRLWPAKERRESAWEALLERFPETAVEVEWLDPYAESADLMWRWRRPAGESAGEDEESTASPARTAEVPPGERTSEQERAPRPRAPGTRAPGTRAPATESTARTTVRSPETGVPVG